MMLEHLKIFVRKATSESRHSCKVDNTRSENWCQKHNVVTTFVFGRSNNVRNTTLWQRYPTSRSKYNQNLTLLQRRVPAELTLKWIFGKKNKPFSENWSTAFQLKVLRLKTPHFHAKLLCQKPMFKEIECGLQNGPIIKNEILPVTSLFFRKFCFSLRTSYK